MLLNYTLRRLLNWLPHQKKLALEVHLNEWQLRTRSCYEIIIGVSRIYVMKMKVTFDAPSTSFTPTEELSCHGSILNDSPDKCTRMMCMA